MDIISYDSEKHDQQIGLWLAERKLPESFVLDFPERTYLVILGSDLVAAAGLDIGKSIACLMGLVTNPNMSSQVRSDAIDILTIKIIQEARSLGFNSLWAWTHNDGIVNRARNHGFEPTSEIMMSLNLRG